MSQAPRHNQGTFWARFPTLTALLRRTWVMPTLLILLVTLCFLPSLSGGFLNYDDPWLIQNNSTLQNSGLGTLATIFTDLSRETRLALGAEFLPMRDVSHWLEIRVFGVNPQGMRVVQLAMYLGAVLLFRGALFRSVGPGLAGELSAFLFALHPVHAESVAWLAGRKDTLALLFIAAALFVHMGRSRHRLWAVPSLLLCAHLSKSMTVIAVALLLALDLLAKRKLDWKLYGASLLVAALAVAAHIHVGQVVGMTSAPVGGSRFAAAATMGAIWLRYAQLCVDPTALSVVHDVVVRTSWDAAALMGWAAVTVWGLAGLAAWRMQKNLTLAAWLWFVVPLVPVSQVVFPLQNLMADRYLFLSAMAPALLIAAAAQRWHRAGTPLCGAIIILLALTMHTRADAFGDNLKLFIDATNKTRSSPIAPYQLGQAFEALRADSQAIYAYEEALRRASGPDERGRRATNNLAKLYARAGRLGDAERVLREGRPRWPNDPKILGNLAEVLVRQGHEAEGRALFEELVKLFPHYAWGRQRYEQRYGPVPE